MYKFRNSVLLFMIMFLNISILKAQTIYDALKLTGQNASYSSRYSALGISYLGIADDGNAVRLNPAGMSLIANSEVSLGLNMSIVSNSNDYLGVNSKNNITSPYLSNASIVAPLRIDDEPSKLVFGFSYNLDNDFKSSISSTAFNTDNSFIKYSADNSQSWTKELLLTDSGTFNTTYINNLEQEIYIRESGGIGSFMAALSYSLSDNFMVGISLGAKNGNYEYVRELTESDTKNLYNTEGVSDLDYMKAYEAYTQDISGFVSSISFVGKVSDFMRVSLIVDMPVSYDITEDFESNYEVQFDKLSNGIIDKFTAEGNSGYADYEIYTPFAFSFASSVHFLDLTIAGAVKYTDNASIEYNSTVSEVMSLNSEIAKLLTGTLKVGIGAEYKIPETDFFLRASFETQNSAYKDNSTSTNSFGFGLGYLLEEKVMLDAHFNLLSESPQTFNIYGTNNSQNTLSMSKFGLSVRYRY